MSTIRTLAALLTIAVGGALVSLLWSVDFPLADGDGGIASPGLFLALVFGGAPIVTGVEALRRQITDRQKRSR